MILETILRWVIPFLLTTFVSFMGVGLKWFKSVKKTIEELPTHMNTTNEDIKTIKKEVKSMNDVMIKNDLAILWSQLTAKCQDVINNEYCDLDTMECIEQLFQRYKELGGNHGMEVLVKKARKYCK